jgi:outer membrane protein, multidrug efflux system
MPDGSPRLLAGLGSPIALALSIALSIATPARAQAAPAQPNAATPDAGGSSEAPPAAPTTPPPIDDPQLAPPPAAPRELRSWDDALAMVRAQSPDYRSTYDNVVRAEARTRVALAALLPNATAQGAFTHQFFTNAGIPDGNGGTINAAVLPANAFGINASASWSIVDLRAYHALRSSKLAVGATQMDLADKRRTIAESVITTMLGTLAVERVAELNRVGLRAALERLSLAQAKTKFGGGTELDLDRASQDVAAARALVISGDEALRQAREALGLSLGSRVAIGAPGSLDLEQFEATVAATCRVNPDLERRADVQAAVRRVLLAKRAVDDIWLSFVPTFVLGSALAWTSQPVEVPPTTWSVDAMINVPIWDGGARYGYLRDARAAADQAEQALASIRLNEVVAVEQASRAVSVTKASRDVAQEQRDLAKRVDERVRKGYLHGLGTSLDLVVSAQALRLAEIDLALLQFQAAQARVLAILANADCVY